MKTIKVRVAVAVDPNGSWNACGCGSLKDDTAMGLAVDPLSDGESRYWLTAELQVPEVAEIVAAVDQA